MKFYKDLVEYDDCDEKNEKQSDAKIKTCIKKFHIIFNILSIICFILLVLFSIIFIKWNIQISKKFETKIEQVNFH
jgi:hypothetical protein